MNKNPTIRDIYSYYILSLLPFNFTNVRHFSGCILSDCGLMMISKENMEGGGQFEYKTESVRRRRREGRATSDGIGRVEKRGSNSQGQVIGAIK